MSLFKKLANYSRQYNNNPQPSRSGSSSSTVRKVCSNCLWYSSYGPHGLYACVKHKFNFSMDDVNYNDAPNRRTCDQWRPK